MNSTGRILFRADGNSRIGLGHIVRMVSLIEMLNKHYDCMFLIRQPDEKVLSLIKSLCPVRILVSQNIIEEMDELETILKPEDMVVTDGYDFTGDYQLFIKSKAKKLIMVDDMADHQYFADLIINHGDPSLTNAYHKQSYTRLLLGFDYLIARREFLAIAKKHREIDEVDAVFICMGGADPYNVTGKAVAACLEVSFIKKIIVVTGGAFTNREALQHQIKNQVSDKSILHEENVSASRLIELVKTCQIAIATASSIALELCCVKVGLLTGMVAHNQSAIHNQLHIRQCCISIGDFNKASIADIVASLMPLGDKSVVESMMRNQAAAIDGLSGERILHEFKELADAKI